MYIKCYVRLELIVKGQTIPETVNVERLCHVDVRRRLHAIGINIKQEAWKEFKQGPLEVNFVVFETGSRTLSYPFPAWFRIQHVHRT